MAVHPRETIRKAVVELLVAAQTSAGDNVFPSREVPWRSVELPGIAVYSLEESSQRMPDGELDRTVVLAIHAVAKLSEGIDDALDLLALEIEKAMAADPRLGGKALISFLGGTEISIDETTQRPIGAIRLAYEVRYYTTTVVA